ncbi:hypothetical protein Ancab_010830 [Ancistrocladus abbreviatus]
MSLKLIFVVTCFTYLLALFTEAHGADAGGEPGGTKFDIKAFGAKADTMTDSSNEIMSAWKQACSSPEPSTLIIRGVYMVAQMELQGPCKAKVTIRLEGTLRAPSSLEKFRPGDAWISFRYIDGLTLLGGGSFDGEGQIAWKENDCAKTGKCNLPINLAFASITNSLVKDIKSLDSKMFHMNILNCKNLTFEHITISAPRMSHNTDGIHIGRSSAINISDADIKTGDDCISLGDGSRQINVEKVTCGPGHGISIGSLGRYKDEQPVVGVTVRNCTLMGTMNGIRVKTWPNSPSSSVASNLHFEDIVMENVSNPILIDQEYCPYGRCKAEVPSQVKITDVSFKNIRGTSASKLAVKLACSRSIPCENVRLSDIKLTYNGKNGSAISECSNVNPAVMGKLSPPICTTS